MSHLKKTEYFISETYSSHNGMPVNQAFNDVKTKRDAFITANMDNIQEIVDEKIDFNPITLYTTGQNLYLVFAVITLNYF